MVKNELEEIIGLIDKRWAQIVEITYKKEPFLGFYAIIEFL